MIASTDYVKALPDGIRPYVPARYKALGTDGFGRSDYRRRSALVLRGRPLPRRGGRLKALAEDQLLPNRRVAEAIAKYGIDPEGPNPARN